MPDEGLFEEFGVDVPKGTAVFRQGDPGGSIYVLRSGRVRLFKESNGRVRAVAELGPGDIFGEMAVINGQPRSATVEVLQDASLLRIPADKFEELVVRGGEVPLRLLRLLTERLDSANRLVDVLVESDASAKVLLEIRRLMDDSDGQAVVAAKPIALNLCLAEEQVSSSLKRLLRVGVLDDATGEVRVRDEARLDDFLRFVRTQEAVA